MLVLIVLMLGLLLLTVTFSVDIAFMQLTRTELRAATDAAARAAGEALSRTQSKSLSRQAAKDYAAQNQVAGKSLQLADNDIIFGNSSPNQSNVWEFTAGGEPINSIRVNGMRTADSLSGSVPLFFGHMLGVDTFEPTETSTVVRLDRDIVLVIDRSGSMAWDLSGVDGRFPPGRSECDDPHPSKSRFAAVNTAVNAFCDAVDTTIADEQLSLVSYSSNTFQCGRLYRDSTINRNLTMDYTQVRKAMSDLMNNPICGSTSISSGIDTGIDVLSDTSRARPFAAKTIVVLTDGIHNSGRSPVLSAQDAAALGIKVHSVTFSNGADEQQMQDVAAATGGKHYHAPDAESLEAIFREIALTLPVIFTE